MLRLGLPHRTMVQDQYRGFDIPADAMIIANIWYSFTHKSSSAYSHCPIRAMNNDDDVYSTPDTFRPERFMEMDPQTLASRDPRNVVFGFGRRCVAQ